jgi:SAM-dependent methyltransferase
LICHLQGSCFSDVTQGDFGQASVFIDTPVNFITGRKINARYCHKVSNFPERADYSPVPSEPPILNYSNAACLPYNPRMKSVMHQNGNSVPELPPSPGEHQTLYSDAIRSARENSDTAFQAWFNRSESVEQSFVRGFWDFSIHMLTPVVCQYITQPEQKTALEIGYGGGRILNAACSYFRQAVGVDIHDEQDTVKTFLEKQGHDNFMLLRTSGSELPAEHASIDFVYSFIVLQHLPTFTTFVKYVEETWRCLKPGGVAQLYFGSFRKIQEYYGWRRFWRYYAQGYYELVNAPVNTTSLVVTVPRAKQVARACGFRVLAHGHSYKTVPDGYPGVRGGQHYVTLLKP